MRKKLDDAALADLAMPCERRGPQRACPIPAGSTREARIEGRSSMSKDELRDAVRVSANA